ncbi:MAG: uracil-DNA glycosylase, partial [Victivallales bacterium]|nr:uracil-DNA glycosylase [Victivallales bacterium]
TAAANTAVPGWPEQPKKWMPPPVPAPDATNFPPPPDVRAADWDSLRQACLACRSCGLCATRHNVVVEDGCRFAPLMFIGEGPGADEDAQGVPFVGKAGQLLTRMIAAMGRNRASADPATAVYIANIVKCLPPRNRVPTLDEARACMGYLHRQIALVRPKVIVLLGNTAMKFMTGHSGIVNARGKWLEVQGIPAMPTFHPSYVIRLEQDPQQFRAVKLQVWQDLQEVMRKLVENQ